MVSKKEDIINFDKLESELNAAIDADERYQRENDAKFRAVHQKVATYEEFRDIVLASHIKPLEKSDNIKQERFTHQWNVQASTFKSDGEKDLNAGEVFNKKKFDKIPKNGHEFTKEWRRNCKTSEDKYQCLMELGADNLGVIFKPEVGFGLLGEFTQTLNEQFQDSDANEVVQILTQLSKTNRFRLNLDFMSTTERNTCKELVAKLEHVFESDPKHGDSSENLTDAQTLLAAIKKQYAIETN